MFILLDALSKKIIKILQELQQEFYAWNSTKIQIHGLER